MIVQKNFLNKLRDFGLNTYESKLWTALLSRGSSTAGELSDIANVPRSRTYDVLESLEKKGFILRRLGKPIKYTAVPPEEVIERVKRKVQQESDMQLKVLGDMAKSTVLDELNLLHSQGIEMVEPTELTGSISGRDNVYNHLESRMSKAETSIILHTTTDGLKRKSKFLAALLKKLKEKKVNVRISTQITKDSKEIVNELSKYADIRHSDIRARFCIIDDKEIVFMLIDDKIVHPSYDMAIWVNTNFFAEAFQKVYDSKWQDMQRFK